MLPLFIWIDIFLEPIAVVGAILLGSVSIGYSLVSIVLTLWSVDWFLFSNCCLFLDGFWFYSDWNIFLLFLGSIFFILSWFSCSTIYLWKWFWLFSINRAFKDEWLFSVNDLCLSFEISEADFLYFVIICLKFYRFWSLLDLLLKPSAMPLNSSGETCSKLRFWEVFDSALRPPAAAAAAW